MWKVSSECFYGSRINSKLKYLMDSGLENQTWQCKELNQIKTRNNFKYANFQKFIHFKLHIEKKLSWNCNCYVAISSYMYMSRVWHLPTGHNSLKYNYRKNKKIKTHSKIYRNFTKPWENKEHKLHSSNRWRVGD